ncbi:MAG: hypothetical protein ACRD3S_13495, partial [Terracidiphilus sp.]
MFMLLNRYLTRLKGFSPQCSEPPPKYAIFAKMPESDGKSSPQDESSEQAQRRVATWKHDP